MLFCYFFFFWTTCVKFTFQKRLNQSLWWPILHLKPQTWQSPFVHGLSLPVFSTSVNFALIKWSFRSLKKEATGIPTEALLCFLSGKKNMQIHRNITVYILKNGTSRFWFHLFKKTFSWHFASLWSLFIFWSVNLLYWVLDDLKKVKM